MTDVADQSQDSQTDLLEQSATFGAMTEGTQLDWQIIAAHNREHAAGLTDRIVTHLRLLDGDNGGFSVDRLEHSVQTATRAYRANKSDEYVICALLHDIGDTLASFNHPDIAAALLKPFVSDDHLWMVEHHGIFQGYNFFHFLGLDRNMREQFLGHPAYDLTVEFCQDFDQPAFDPKYDSMSIEDFLPAMREMFTAPRKSVYITDDGKMATDA
ncbi:MAG: putative HD phosphohydrolase [Candidatus Poriferisodalaceae bacterium]|jgi:predicted HD phosphohydrolase